MTTTHWDRLEELRAEHRKRITEHRDLEAKAREAQRAPGDASDALARAFSEDATAATVKKLEKALDQARARAAEPWNERVRGHCSRSRPPRLPSTRTPPPTSRR